MNWLIIAVVSWCVGMVAVTYVGLAWVVIPSIAITIIGQRSSLILVMGVALCGGAMRMHAHQSVPLLDSDSIHHHELVIHESVRDWQGQRVTAFDTHQRGFRWEAPAWPQWQRGQRLVVSATVQPFANHINQYQDQLIRQRIVAELYGVTVHSVATNNALLLMIDSARLRCQALILRHFHEPMAGIVSGMLLGSAGDMSEQIEDAFRRSGTAHILVISGWNITIVASLCQSMTRLIRGGRTMQLLLPLTIIATYVCFTGASAAVIRAGVMGCIMVIGKWLERPRHMPTIMAGAIGLISLVQPHSLWDLGMQLSAAATIGLIAFATPIDTWLSKGSFGHPSLAWAREGLATTVAAQIPTLPIMLGRLVAPSLWSILANVLITPVVPYAMLFGTISILCGFISPVLMEYVAWGAVPFFAWIISGSLAFATLPAPVVPVFMQPWHELIGHITWVGIWLWHSAKGEGGTSEKNRWYSSSHM